MTIKDGKAFRIHWIGVTRAGLVRDGALRFRDVGYKDQSQAVTETVKGHLGMLPAQLEAWKHIRAHGNGQ